MDPPYLLEWATSACRPDFTSFLHLPLPTAAAAISSLVLLESRGNPVDTLTEAAARTAAAAADAESGNDGPSFLPTRASRTYRRKLSPRESHVIWSIDGYSASTDEMNPATMLGCQKQMCIHPDCPFTEV